MVHNRNARTKFKTAFPYIVHVRLYIYIIYSTKLFIMLGPGFMARFGHGQDVNDTATNKTHTLGVAVFFQCDLTQPWIPVPGTTKDN